MYNFIGFSKDRPAQLDLFLRSAKLLFKEFHSHEFKVLYVSSGEEYTRGYATLKEKHPNVVFICQTGLFKECLLTTIDPQSPRTMFFVDDDVFKEPFSLSDDEVATFNTREDIACLSLRMCPRINYCYTRDAPISPPEFSEKWVWKWRGCPADWGYPFSLDCHIFRTEDIYSLLCGLQYSNPNYLEGMLEHYPPPHPYMKCYDEARIVNIPANRVQNANENRCGRQSAKELNDMFLAGKQISLTGVVGLKVNSPHCDIPFQWEENQSLS